MPVPTEQEQLRRIVHPDEEELTAFLDATDLTPKELLFVQYYTGTFAHRRTGPNKDVRPWNATKAARAAGYDHETAGMTAGNLLKKPKVREKIRERLGHLLRAADINAVEVLSHYKSIALANSQDFLNEDGTLIPLRHLPRHLTAAVSSLEVEEIYEGRGEQRRQVGWTKRLKFWDKARALEVLKAYAEGSGADLTVRHVVVGPDGGPVEHRVRYEDLPPDELARLYRERAAGGEGEDA